MNFFSLLSKVNLKSSRGKAFLSSHCCQQPAQLHLPSLLLNYRSDRSQSSYICFIFRYENSWSTRIKQKSPFQLRIVFLPGSSGLTGSAEIR